MKPPSRLFFTAVEDELDCETIPVLIDEPDHFRGFGSGSDAKKPRQLSTTRWCCGACGFHVVAWAPLQQDFQAKD